MKTDSCILDVNIPYLMDYCGVQYANSEDDSDQVIIDKLHKIDAALNESVLIPASKNDLTVVIAFYNEKEELIKTVESVRKTAGNEVDIIVVNDCSDDDFPYLSELNKYNVVYCINKHRLGAALSKERGIRLSVTPYFIVLDAHMRIYTSKWHEILIQDLKSNSQGIVCCQSVVLVRQENGDVKRADHGVRTYGAYLSFRDDKLLPGIHWFTNIEAVPSILNRNGNEIAAVLGGCYASSKAYWNLIDGYEGLLYYGCEEAYISIKSWLQGAGCRIVPDIEIGHIYKTEPNFKVIQYSYVYNYLAIAEVCFPEYERCEAHLKAQSYNMYNYYEACRVMEANYDKISSLRRKWSVLYDSFYKVKKINLQFALAESRLWSNACARISDVVDFVYGHNPTNIGLVNGSMGDLLFLLRYIKLMKITDGILLDRCADIYSEIKRCIDKRCLTWNFENGYAGIGWGIMYMRDHGLVEDDVTAILAKVDENMSCISPKRIIDSSLYSGLSGVVKYVGRRSLDSDNCLDEVFLEELKNACKVNKLMSIDMLCLENRIRYNCNPAEIGDIIKPIHFIPRSEKQWKHGLEGVTGHVLQMMELKEKSGNEKESI